jgi:hypothetical protein
MYDSPAYVWAIIIAGATAGLAAPLPIASPDPDLPCAGEPELFFAESPGDVELAKALCRECPVRAACLAGARGRPCQTDVAA